MIVLVPALDWLTMTSYDKAVYDRWGEIVAAGDVFDWGS